MPILSLNLKKKKTLNFEEIHILLIQKYFRLFYQFFYLKFHDILKLTKFSEIFKCFKIIDKNWIQKL